MKESDFEQAVVETARLFGWKAVGHRPMRTKHGWATGWKYDGTGWPDLTLIHAERGILIAAELKTAKGRLSEQQIEWERTLKILQANSDNRFRFYVWRPDDWDIIVQLLSDGKAQ